MGFALSDMKLECAAFGHHGAINGCSDAVGAAHGREWEKPDGMRIRLLPRTVQ